MQEKQEDGINHFTDSILPFLNKEKTTTKNNCTKTSLPTVDVEVFAA